MGRDDIAVVMPVRDGSAYIAEAIQSALDQGPMITQVLVVDDGSSDGTAEIVRGFADPRVSFVLNHGRGVSSARNCGIALATCEWVLFVDADDRLAPFGVPVLLREARAEAVAVYGDYDRIDSKGRRRGLRHLMRSRRGKPSGDVLETIVSMNFIAVGTVMIRRAALQQVGGFDQSLHLCEDWLLWCRLAAIGPIDYVRGLHVVDYRIHFASTMHRRARAFADVDAVLEHIFADPLICRRLDPARIPASRALAEINLRLYVAIEAMRLGDWRLALVELMRSARHAPASIPRLTWRLAASMAGM